MSPSHGASHPYCLTSSVYCTQLPQVLARWGRFDIDGGAVTRQPRDYFKVRGLVCWLICWSKYWILADLAVWLLAP